MISAELLKSHFTDKVARVYEIGRASFIDGAHKWQYERPFENRPDCELYDPSAGVGKIPFYVGFQQEAISVDDVKNIIRAKKSLGADLPNIQCVL